MGKKRIGPVAAKHSTTTNTITTMEITDDNVLLVKREDINGLTFPKEEVLDCPSAISKRNTALHYATSLGTLLHQKVVILFEDRERVKRVKASIWAMADSKVFFKDNQTIPINRIHSVNMA